MQYGDEVSRRLDEVCTAWNKAEKAAKQAEQVNGEIVNPAIYELRYAGRRIVEALERLARGEEHEALGLLKDAHFDCTRSRHDAIDAATSKVALDLKIAVERLGADALLKSFPQIIPLRGKLFDTRKLIAVSREDRENRDKVYETVQRDNLDEIIQGYNEFQASEPLLVCAARRQRVERWIDRGIGIVGVIVALAAWIYAVH